MKFLCFGTGAIGTYIGGSLALAGHPVTFLERPAVASIIRSNGLSLDLVNGHYEIPNPDIVVSLEMVLKQSSSYDAAILAVKAYDTAGLLTSLKPYQAFIPPILCMQNGIENEDMISSEFGEAGVLPCTVTTAIGRKGPGQIVVEKLRGVGLAAGYSLTEAVMEAMNQAGLKASAIIGAKAMKWSKMLTNLLANASSAILNMTPAAIFAHPGLHNIEMQMIRETLAVMDRQGIPVVDLPGTPVRLLAWAIRSLPSIVGRPLMVQALGKGRGQKMPSFHIDLYSGRDQSEVGFLNGAVVRAGQQLGVPTPVNSWLTRTLQSIVDGTLAVDLYADQPEKFIKAIIANS